MAVSEKGWIFVVGRIFPQSNVKGQFYNNLPTHSDWNFGTPKKLQIEHFNDAKDSSRTPFSTSAKNVDGKYESNGSTGYRGSFSSSSFVVEDDAEEGDPFEVFTRKKSTSDQTKHRSSVELTPKRVDQSDSSPEKAREAGKTENTDKKNGRKSSGGFSDVSYESTGTGYRGSFSSSSFVIEDDEEQKDPFEIFTRKKSVA